MKVIKNAGKEAVTRVEVITPAIEATYDLIGLSESQMAIICILVGRSSGSGADLFNLYDTVHDALGQPDMEVAKTRDFIQDNCLIMDSGLINRLLITRKC